MYATGITDLINEHIASYQVFIAHPDVTSKQHGADSHSHVGGALGILGPYPEDRHPVPLVCQLRENYYFPKSNNIKAMFK